MKQVLLFAGTTEGRILTEYLNTQKVATQVCVATEYGEHLLHSLSTLTPNESPSITISSERLSCDQIIDLINKECFQMVIDASHPYATIVSSNIQHACTTTHVTYYRVLRETSSLLTEDSSTVFVSSIDEAVEYLRHTTGNIFVTTGSKELHKFTKLPDYENRLFARTLPSPDIVRDCYELGVKGKHLICMQGPFSTEINRSMLKHVDARYLVTKESGLPGGFLQKIEAAKQANVTCIIIGRPQDVKGYTLNEMKAVIRKQLN